MIIVTGTAPRCGTSAMMRTLLAEYKPHSYAKAFPSYTARDQNPEGFWDISQDFLFADDPIPTEEDAVLKLWAPQFHRISIEDVSLLVVMSRPNFIDQVESIHRCAVAEGFTADDSIISSMFKNQRDGINTYFNETPTIRVNMETLREEPNMVLEAIKEMKICQQ